MFGSLKNANLLLKTDTTDFIQILKNQFQDCSTLISVLNGQLASYVDSEVVRKQVDVNSKTLDVQNFINSNNNNINNDQTSTTSQDGSSNAVISSEASLSTAGNGSTSTGNGSTTGNSSATSGSSSKTTGSNSTTESDFEFVSSADLIPGNSTTPKTNVTASSKFSSSLQQDAEASLEPLTSRKSGAGALQGQKDGALIVALLSTFVLCRWK
jgi:hypothetical protein